MWAAYKKGCLVDIEPEVFSDTSMTAEEFRAAFHDTVIRNYDAAWTLFAPSPKGHIPVGLVVGFWPHQNQRIQPFMFLGAMVWFPWATSRNRIESAVNFFNEIRKEIQMVEFAKQKDKRFFEIICSHGLMRRVGTMHNVYDEPAAVFETRKP